MLVENTPALAESKTLVYEILTESDLTSAIECVSRVFVNHEPLCQKLNLIEADMQGVARAFCHTAIAERTAIIVKDKLTNRVIGFCIGHNFQSDPFADGDEAEPRLEPIMMLLEQLYGHFEQQPELTENALLINIGGVDLQYLRDRGIEVSEPGNGIAGQLFKLMVELARKRGFDRSIGAATSFFSQTLLKSFDFEEIFRVDYNEFAFNGQPIFKGMPWHHSAQLLMREL